MAQKSSEAETAPEPEPQPAAEPIVWLFEVELESIVEFDEFVREVEENTWAKLKSEPTGKGLKTVYRCNHVKRRGTQCSAGIYTLTNKSPGDTKVSLFRKNHQHDHDNLVNKAYEPISGDVKQRVIDMYRNRSSPKSILYVLDRDENIPQMSITQIYNIIKAYKNKEFGQSGVSLNDLTEFVKHKINIPDDPDEAFVVAFDRPNQDEDVEPWFRMFVSTKRLLDLATLAKNIHADGTYKLTVEGHPLLAVGTSDMGGHFHLLGLMLATSETANDYEFLFRALRHGVEDILKKKIDISVLVSDAAAAIHNGFDRVFNDFDFETIMCYFHVILNFNKRKFNNASENKQPIRDDIEHLKMAHSKDVFAAAHPLFIQKWAEKEPEFTKNFEEMYLRRNPNWYNGAVKPKLAPTTNNCMERFNGSLKQHQTHHERHGLNRFKLEIFDIVSDRSREYIGANPKVFQTEVSIDKKTMDKGQEYAKSNKNFLMKKDESHICFYVFAGEKNGQVSKDHVDDFENKNYQSFDDYKTRALGMHRITFDQDVTTWKSKAACTCPAFSKNYMCKHVVAFATTLKLIKPKSNFDEPMTRKVKGRPRKATPSLQKD